MVPYIPFKECSSVPPFPHSLEPASFLGWVEEVQSGDGFGFCFADFLLVWVGIVLEILFWFCFKGLWSFCWVGFFNIEGAVLVNPKPQNLKPLILNPKP